jgi:hypothetical protein
MSCSTLKHEFAPFHHQHDMVLCCSAYTENLLTTQTHTALCRWGSLKEPVRIAMIGKYTTLTSCRDALANNTVLAAGGTASKSQSGLP